MKNSCKRCKHLKRLKIHIGSKWKFFPICDLFITEKDGWALHLDDEDGICEEFTEVEE